MKKFTYYWHDGKRDVFEGESAADAITKAGYGGGILGALDFYAEGDNTKYEWDTQTRKWIRKEIQNG